MKKIIIISLSILFLISCEDVIDITVDDGKPQLTVDAILTNLDEPQIVRLTLSGDYFDMNSVQAIDDAEVTMVDNSGAEYTFEYRGNGEYHLNESSTDFDTGMEFTLNIRYNSEEYTAFSKMLRIPEIDSITWRRENQVIGDLDSIWLVQFWAVDLPGIGDAYWVRGTRNGTIDNSPSSIVTAYDGSTGRGSVADAIPFILPIRASITPGGITGPPADNIPELVVGETIGVRFHSIPIKLAEYLDILSEQLNNGGIFAPIPANTTTNIYNTNPDGTKALGWFEVCNTRADSAVITWERFNNRK